MNGIWKVAFILSLAGSVIALDKTKATGFADARAAAEANMGTLEGGKYVIQLGTYFMQKHSRDFDLCRKKVSPVERGSEIMLKVDKDGNAIEMLARPSRKLGKCIRAAILKDKFPAPPRPDYWASLEIGTGIRQ